MKGWHLSGNSRWKSGRFSNKGKGELWAPRGEPGRAPVCQEGLCLSTPPSHSSLCYQLWGFPSLWQTSFSSKMSCFGDTQRSWGLYSFFPATMYLATAKKLLFSYSGC